jgi:hypothetical protein
MSADGHRGIGGLPLHSGESPTSPRQVIERLKQLMSRAWDPRVGQLICQSAGDDFRASYNLILEDRLSIAATFASGQPEIVISTFDAAGGEWIAADGMLNRKDSFEIYWGLRDVARNRRSAQLEKFVTGKVSNPPLSEEKIVEMVKRQIARARDPEVGELITSGTKQSGMRFELTFPNESLRITAAAHVVDGHRHFTASVAAYDRSSSEWKPLYTTTEKDFSHRIYDALMHASRVRITESQVAGIAQAIDRAGLS